jgi:signal transduction histidine kinase
VKLVYRLLIFALGVITVFTTVSVMLVDKRLRDRMVNERAAELGRDARLIGGQWTKTADPHKLAARAAEALGGRVSLISKSGVIIADASDGVVPVQVPGAQAKRPEVAHALSGVVGVHLEEGDSTSQGRLHVAVPTEQGVVRVAEDMASLNGIFDVAIRDMISAGFLATLCVCLFAGLFANYVSKPVIQLRDMARALSRREFDNHPAIDAPGEVGDLADSLTQLSGQLQNLEGVRRDFIANVSHELCSPLTIASGFAATLARHDPPAEERQQFARAILSSTNRMQRVIDDMLDLTRIESGGWTPRPETISLFEATTDVLDSLRPAANRKGVALLCDFVSGAGVIIADRTAVRQTIANLSENAIRHTHSGSITVFTELTPEGVWLGVRDTGEGIASYHLPRIFERLYRVDSGRARRSGGSGLGLAIVKHMAEAHGGRVFAESEPGLGTTIKALYPQPNSRPRVKTPVEPTRAVAFRPEATSA